jgi:hypothetical protein
MRSSTSSSDLRFVVVLAATFGVLLGSWELVLRKRGSATVEFGIFRPPVTAAAERGEKWVIFGNCLLMTGLSPKRLQTAIGDGRERRILNIASHEQSPIAYLEYLRRAGHYPDVVLTNVSSWINGTNFDQEATLVAKQDPLGLVHPERLANPNGGEAAEDKVAGPPGSGEAQRRIERDLSQWTYQRFPSLGHRYHLFDYALFLGTLVSSRNLDNALYQLGMQAWFRVTDSETDGQGYLGLRVKYRDDWDAGLDLMAERYLKRMRLSRVLTQGYWQRLEESIRDFQSHGTKVLLVRMPEHPTLRAFNDATYDLPARLQGLEARTKAPVLDLSRLGPAEGVHLFDAVHPDQPASEVVTTKVGEWIRTRIGADGGGAKPPAASGQ